MQIAIARAQLSNIVEQVRNLILNWSLELEKAGILGEHMQFSEQEKGDAKPLTQQFIIQNVGVLGNVTDHATVENQLSATATIQLDLGEVRNFLKQATAALPQLPRSDQEKIGPLLTDLNGELNKTSPDRSRLREMLSSVRKIAEGATGSLTAQGIIAMIEDDHRRVKPCLLQQAPCHVKSEGASHRARRHRAIRSMLMNRIPFPATETAAQRLCRNALGSPLAGFPGLSLRPPPRSGQNRWAASPPLPYGVTRPVDAGYLGARKARRMDTSWNAAW